MCLGGRKNDPRIAICLSAYFLVISLFEQRKREKNMKISIKKSGTKWSTAQFEPQPVKLTDNESLSADLNDQQLQHIESPPKKSDIDTSQEIEDPASFDSQTTVMTESVRQMAQIEIEKNLEIPIDDVEMPIVIEDDDNQQPDGEFNEQKTEVKITSEPVEPNQTENAKEHQFQQPTYKPIQRDKEEVKS